MKKSSPETIPKLAVAFAYLLWAIWLTIPLIFHMADGLPKDLGDPLLNTWILAWETRILVNTPWKVFDAPIFYPHTGTLAYSESLLGILPFAFPFIMATGIPALGYNIVFLISFWLNALGVYHFVRAAGGCQRAAFVTGLLSAALPYRFAQISHIHILYMGWIFLAMSALIHYFNHPGWRQAVNLSLAILLMALSSWHLAILGAIALGFLLLFIVWERRISLRVWLGLGAVFIVCGSVIGLIAWPYLKVAPNIARDRGIELAYSFAAWPIDLLAASPDLRILGPLTAPFRVPGHTNCELQLYSGSAILIAAIFGIRQLKTSFLRRTALTLIGIGVVMALGPVWKLGPWWIYSPYWLLTRLFPGLTLIRATARWFILVLISFSILAGFGLTCALQNRRWLAILWIILGIIEGWAIPINIVPLPRLSSLPAVYHWLAHQPGEFAVLELPVFFPLDAKETIRMYAGLLHRKPLVVAYSGYIPPDIRRLEEKLRFFPQSEALEEIARLSELGLRYVLVDRSQSEFRNFYEQGLCEVSRDFRFNYVGYMEPYEVFEVHPPSGKFSPPLMQSVEVRFGEVAILRKYGIRWLSAEQLEVWLLWEAGSHPRGDYSITVQALDKNGWMVAQRDGPPNNGGYYFWCWRPGERFLDRRILEASSERMSQTIQLGIAIYKWPSLERLPVHGTGLVIDNMLRLELTTVSYSW
ncbi:MAG: hypothetical protein QXS01_03720 [Candidatus Bathyarchaeia archaeon]